MTRKVSVLLAVFTALVSAQHQSLGQATDWAQIHAEDDAAWAKRSELTVAEVRDLRKMAGVADRSSELIDDIDAKTLVPYNLILFATYAGSARCVSFWLFSKTGEGFQEFWKSGDIGDKLNICADPQCKLPVVEAKPNRDLEVQIPSHRKNGCVSDSFALLKWTGTSYSYRGILSRNRLRKAR